MKGEFKKWHELEDGDIFWCDPVANINEQIITYMALLAGKDQIFITDDVCIEEDDYGCIIVNGGHDVNFTPDCIVYKLGEYSDLINNLNRDKDEQD